MCNGRMDVLRQAGGVQRLHLAAQCDTITQPLPDHYQPIARPGIAVNREQTLTALQ